MAVAHNGTLHQHLPDLLDTNAHRETTGAFTEHAVRIDLASRLGQIAKVAEAIANSSHHQGVDSPGTLTPVAWALDGVIEACEDRSANFAIGVQWHPELLDNANISTALFAAFVRSAMN
jgi:putative glutamine amidotransferase